jgi:hypothetical protein
VVEVRLLNQKPNVAQLTSSRYGVYARSTQYGHVVCNLRVYYCIRTKYSVLVRPTITKAHFAFHYLTFAFRLSSQIRCGQDSGFSNLVQIFRLSRHG